MRSQWGFINMIGLLVFGKNSINTTNTDLGK